jgi:predicted GH43/DUF377 family glycosyl hydrolase
MKKLIWTKKGLLFNPKEHNTPDWINEFAQAPHVLFFDDFIRVYFSCRPLPDHNGQYVSYSAYVDYTFDFEVIKIAEEPILELGEAGTFDEFGTYPVTVIKSNDDYLAYYAGWTRCEAVPFNTAIGLAKSKDASKFTKIGKGPLISYSIEEPFVISGPKIRKFNEKFYLFYIAGSRWILDNGKPEPIYKIRLAISEDGIHFKKLNKNLIEDKIDVLEAQASPDVIFKNNKYHMFFCYRGGKDYRGKENGYRIGYAFSEDLIHWTRNDEYVGIDISDNGWDSEMISYPHVFELNDKIHMFYLGNQVGKQGFGWAILENELL